jgi:hypothetical protein
MASSAFSHTERIAQILEEIECLRSGVEPPLPEAIDEAKSLLSSVHYHIPEGDVFEINQGVQVNWWEGNLHLRLFCSGLGSGSYIYKARTEDGEISSKEVIPDPSGRTLEVLLQELVADQPMLFA